MTSSAIKVPKKMLNRCAETQELRVTRFAIKERFSLQIFACSKRAYLAAPLSEPAFGDGLPEKRLKVGENDSDIGVKLGRLKGGEGIAGSKRRADESILVLNDSRAAAKGERSNMSTPAPMFPWMRP